MTKGFYGIWIANKQQEVEKITRQLKRVAVAMLREDYNNESVDIVAELLANAVAIEECNRKVRHYGMYVVIGFSVGLGAVMFL